MARRGSPALTISDSAAQFRLVARALKSDEAVNQGEDELTLYVAKKESDGDITPRLLGPAVFTSV